jgi:hypothetical protein
MNGHPNVKNWLVVVRIVETGNTVREDKTWSFVLRNMALDIYHWSLMDRDISH